MKAPLGLLALVLVAASGLCHAADKPDKPGRPSLRVRWKQPATCTPFAPPRIKDLKEELRQTGYRLVLAIHPDKKGKLKGQYPPRDLFLVGADGSGLRQITKTPGKDERVPRTSPDGKKYTYNYGDVLVDVATGKTTKHYGGYVWAPHSKRTVHCGKRGIVYTDIATGKNTPPVAIPRRVDVVDLSCDGKWFIFEIRNYLGRKYTIDFMPALGGKIRKLPNHPAGGGECHPRVFA